MPRPDEIKVSALADRACLFLGVWSTIAQREIFENGGDPKGQQIQVFAQIAGVTEYEALAAFAELEDHGLAQSP